LHSIPNNQDFPEITVTNGNEKKILLQARVNISFNIWLVVYHCQLPWNFNPWCFHNPSEEALANSCCPSAVSLNMHCRIFINNARTP